MKKTAATFLLCLAAIFARGQATTFIRGEMDIQFNTKTHPNELGVKDVYTINVNVCNSAIFRGTVSQLPGIIDKGLGILSPTVKQARSLDYDLTCDVVNPANPQQTKKIGRLYGTVPIDQAGVYQYTLGSLECTSTASKFTGLVAGKPTGQKAQSLQDRLAMVFAKRVNGKVVRTKVTKYDKLAFQSAVMASGPVPIYPETVVSGEMVYDYDRFIWYFNNVKMDYADSDGTQKTDRLTGDIRWVEDENRKANGLGQYEFDVRVNEPPATEQSSFSGASDESSYFAGQDATLSSLTGTMKYTDRISPDGDTLSSKVAIDLTGNRLTKRQTMALCKLLEFSAIVPMNSD